MKIIVLEGYSWGISLSLLGKYIVLEAYSWGISYIFSSRDADYVKYTGKVLPKSMGKDASVLNDRRFAVTFFKYRFFSRENDFLNIFFTKGTSKIRPGLDRTFPKIS